MAKYTLMGFYNIEHRHAVVEEIESNSNPWQPVLQLDYLHPNVMKEMVQHFVETDNHFIAISSHGDIFNLFGAFVYDGKIKKEDVRVIVYTQSNEREEYNYDEQGCLVNWPFGFFEMSYNYKKGHK